jgi:hypothetical protein
MYSELCCEVLSKIRTDLCGDGERNEACVAAGNKKTLRLEYDTR